MILFSTKQIVICVVSIIAFLSIIMLLYKYKYSCTYDRFMRMDTKCDQFEFNLDFWLNKKYELYKTLSKSDDVINPAYIADMSEKYSINNILDDKISKLSDEQRLEFKEIDEKIIIYSQVYNRCSASYNRARCRNKNNKNARKLFK